MGWLDSKWLWHLWVPYGFQMLSPNRSIPNTSLDVHITDYFPIKDDLPNKYVK